MLYADINTWASGFVFGVDAGYVTGGFWICGILYTPVTSGSATIRSKIFMFG